MKVIVVIASVFVCLFSSCGLESEPGELSQKNVAQVKVSRDSASSAITTFSEESLVAFLDSVGAAAPSAWTEGISRVPDSMFMSQKELNVKLSEADFRELKKACVAGEIKVELAQRIFKDMKAEKYQNQSMMDVGFFSFDADKDKFEKFAVSPDYTTASPSSELYFFEGNKLVAKHNIAHWYGLELAHYKDEADGRTVLYYKVMLNKGTGIWWFNYHFYKYIAGKLVPVLCELQDGNHAHNFSSRDFRLKASVQKTHPLTLKMVYFQAYAGRSGRMEFFRDSTLVEYIWDEKSKTLVGDYTNSKLSRLQILTYCPDSLLKSQLLFMHSYYRELKALLDDPSGKQQVLAYLSMVRRWLKAGA